ncbi:hypothetical protein GYA13_02955 [Candidatus Kuenenbacteria bacterium]|nr:hypothetical protein [Candidatus Kuenenbacteria bacterium]
MLRLGAMAGALIGLSLAMNLQSDWKWVIVGLNACALIATAAIRERSPWFMDRRLRDRDFNIRLIIFIAVALMVSLISLWPK